MSIVEETEKGKVTEYVAPPLGKRFIQGLAPSKVGALYVLILAVIVFSFFGAPTFAHVSSFQGILNNNALGLIAALAVILPLAAGVFDLSQASTMSLTGLVVGYFNANHHMGFWPSVIIAMAFAILAGLVNILVVVVFKIDSFIGTLATGSIILALGFMVSSGQAILDSKFANLGNGELWGLVYPCFFGVGIAIVVWYIFEHTAFGRQIYATGFNARAAKLAGVKTAKLQAVTLMIGALVAGFAGLILLCQQGQATAGNAAGYQLTSFAAVFLGATQFKSGRFNAQGTILAILLLGVGTTGLTMSNAPQWTPQAFTGLVLIVSLAATGLKGRKVSFARKPQVSEESHMENTEIEVQK